MPIDQCTAARINLEKIAIMRGNRLIMQNFSMAANPGDVIWLRGANGTGKSTLLRVIGGLLPVLTGLIEVEGAISLVDMTTILDQSRTLEQSLAFWAKLDEASADRRESALKAFDLNALVDVPMRYLSSGQKKRAAIAMAMASLAPIWLLDEPYNALDSANMARLDDAILRHVANGGIAIVAAHQPPTITVTETISLDVLSAKALAA